MKKVIIFGAGQAGRAVYRLIHGKNQQVIAFADNNPNLAGTSWDGVPILTLGQAVEQNPGCIYLAMVNRDSCGAVGEALRQAGYAGPLYALPAQREKLNIRLATLRLIVEEIKKRKVPGALAELGVYQGEFAEEINRLLPDRALYLFDTFEGFDARDIQREGQVGSPAAKPGDFSDTSVEGVLARLPHPDKIVVRQGYFPETAAGLEDRFALVSLDADLYQPMYEGLSYFFPRMNPGGYLILHDYNSSQFKGAGKAVQAYCEENGLYVFPLCDVHGTGVLVKNGMPKIE